MSREDFLRDAWAAANKVSAESGLPAGVTVAQAALESRWGESGLAVKAKNYFGIKAHGKLAWVEMPTTEVENGKAKKVFAKFAAYDSMEQCFASRDRLILTSAYYIEARAAAKDPMKFMDKLAAHWATDPSYGEKLRRVFAEVVSGYRNAEPESPGTREQEGGVRE